MARGAMAELTRLEPPCLQPAVPDRYTPFQLKPRPAGLLLVLHRCRIPYPKLSMGASTPQPAGPSPARGPHLSRWGAPSLANPALPRKRWALWPGGLHCSPLCNHHQPVGLMEAGTSASGTLSPAPHPQRQ